MTFYKPDGHTSKLISLFIFGLFLLVSNILPFFSFDGYSIVSNTTSHLGAQGSPYAWMMNITFMLLGARSLQLTSYHNSVAIRLFGLMFGTSLILTGVFRHAPLIEGIPVNVMFDTFHSVFATSTGLSFALVAFSSFVYNKSKQRYISLLLLVIATIVPLTMMIFPSMMGITQRFMFISAFMWIFFGEISFQASKRTRINY